MRKLNYLLFTAALLAFMSSCTLQKMLKIAKDQQLEVTPSPLEVHGNKVAFEMSAVVPPRTLPKGKVYTINTFYQFNDREVKVGSIDFAGNDFPNSMSTTSRLAKTFTFDYQEGMDPGNLVIEGVASNPMSKKFKSSPKMPVAGGEGLILTSQLIKDLHPVSYADHGYNDKEELEPTRVDFYFDKGQSIFKASEKNSARGNDLTAFIAAKNVTRTVTITGAHSPEGTERVNKNLAADRAEVIEKHYRALMKKYDYKGKADSIKFVLKPVVEDWTSFKESIASFDGISSSQKAEINKIVNGTGSFEDKEKALSALPEYSMIVDKLYPPLRVAKTEILTVKVKKPNAEIAVLAKQIVDGKANADALTYSELMFAATLTPSLKEKEAIFKAATKKDDNWKAHNNLGAVYLQMAKDAEGAERNRLVEEATTQLEIAANKMKAPEVWSNMATAQIMQMNYDQAYTSLLEGEKGSASEMVSRNISSAKGVIEAKQGKYDLAVASLSSGIADNNDATFDKGLSYLLKKEFDSADAAFDEVIKADKNYALAHYTKAIVAARKNSESSVISNLKNAVSIDPSLKGKAMDDLEFGKFKTAISNSLK